MIDWGRVSALREEVGREAFEEVVLMFLEETDETIRRLSAAPVAPLDEMLHFLKGSALNLGFRSVSRLCQEGERLAACGRGAEVELGVLVTSYRLARVEFLKGLERMEAG
ncbi:nickel transporter [Rhodobacter sphaeroides]|jgi:Hpt domain.|uniref:HPT, Histidine Phosphotransfer domain protein n=1 Tax=Cereibacter sphaeroides (strain ATCC 17023 / DSM 158 / JCM 6121 / CCUG 31486 / LMG 2827 / NBRC 12203 / NCIMB 8253 / ATH 2.4.1.) TaxID=272943 RepID=Q3IYJ2_CERS4|nr:Hpt domain-containing protein [Cereibacter sphaeroides]ABA80392.1 putative HPT, Histidine Phosphotransfer domain protein [Cereibacter sphaeroides 2.4.1]AMJ48624.1 nickel transporter [Cereibacter sphaeroides]ANS35339.1 nickel transporter [Cereibacter sphaeroides]ATN64392.1 nickel transporter [Cereibacter sphaeroides]AXC62580.1 nickel transporter [Cereibacter sphaeroides 2.4.1]